MTTNQTIKEESVVKILEENNLYYIAIKDKPLLLRRYLVLLYTDKEKATATLDSLKTRFNNDEITILKIGSTDYFVEKMSACGIKKFLLNGEGKIYDFNDYKTNNPNNRIYNPKGIYEEILAAQPVRTTDQNTRSKGMIKSLPSVHKTRLFGAYIWGILILISSIVYLIFGYNDYTYILPCFSLWFAMYGIICISKLKTRLKTKRPEIVRLAKLSSILYVLGLLIYIIAAIWR